MSDDVIENEAAILKKIDEQTKGLSADIRAEAFQILVQRHLGGKLTADVAHNRGRATPPRHTKPRSKVQLSVVKDLNLKKDGTTPSLRDFFAQKSPQTFLEQNVLFVYYLQRLREIPNITQNHIYTSYKEVNLRVPGAFYQSLLDTRTRGWIDTANTEDIRITTVGENFVEHDLPRQSKD